MYSKDNLINNSQGYFADPESDSEQVGGQTMAPPPFQLFASGAGEDSSANAPIQMVGKKGKEEKKDGNDSKRSSKKRDRDEQESEENNVGTKYKKMENGGKKKVVRRSGRKRKTIYAENFVDMDEPLPEKKNGKEPDHNMFTPRNVETKKKDNHLHFEYQGIKEDDYEVEFSGSEDSSEEGPVKKKRKHKSTRRIHGKNLTSKKQKSLKNRRGVTDQAPGFESNKGQNSSHLVADQHKGSGHNKKRGNVKSWNTIPTSNQYNQVIMAEIESQINKVVGKGEFDLQVYPYFFEDNDPEKIENYLKVTNPSNSDEVSDSIRSNSSKLSAKRVKKVIYEVKTKKGVKYRGETGPDIALGSIDRKENDEEFGARKTGKKLGKKGKEYRKTIRQVSLKENKDLLIKPLQKVEEGDEFYWGDKSYREDDRGFNSESEDENGDEVMGDVNGDD